MKELQLKLRETQRLFWILWVQELLQIIGSAICVVVFVVSLAVDPTMSWIFAVLFVSELVVMYLPRRLRIQKKQALIESADLTIRELNKLCTLLLQLVGFLQQYAGIADAVSRVKGQLDMAAITIGRLPDDCKGLEDGLQKIAMALEEKAQIDSAMIALMSNQLLVLTGFINMRVQSYIAYKIIVSSLI